MLYLTKASTLMTMRERTKQLGQQVKVLLTSWYGWLAFFLANLFWTLPWLIQIIIGFFINDPRLYASALATLTFMSLPFPIPMWLITPLTAFAIYKKIFKK